MWPGRGLSDNPSLTVGLSDNSSLTVGLPDNPSHTVGLSTPGNHRQFIVSTAQLHNSSTVPVRMDASRRDLDRCLFPALATHTARCARGPRLTAYLLCMRPGDRGRLVGLP